MNVEIDTMEVEFTCLYCGKQWSDHVWGLEVDKECPVCKDSDLKVRAKDESNKIDYYSPFPEKRLQKKK